MIYHTEKQNIIAIIFGLCYAFVLVLLLCWFIFKQYLWPLMEKINDNSANQLANTVIVAIILFILFSTKAAVLAYSRDKIYDMRGRLASNLYLYLYEKALSLDLSECDKKQVISIVGTDVEAIKWGILYVFVGISAMISFLCAMVFLYVMVGVSAIFGIIFIIFIAIPCQLFVGYKLSYYGQLRKSCTDNRIQLITELIGGIRVLKLSAYELPLLRQIFAFRDNELKYNEKRNFCLSLIILTNFLGPAIMLFITLMIYCFALKQKVNTNIIVFMLMIFSIIQVLVKVVPLFIGHTVSILVACGRIDAFCRRKSVDIVQNKDKSEEDHCNAIKMFNASFSWTGTVKADENNEKVAFCLEDISINIERGKLVAIIGSVGSGKTSLIQSILGELECIKGSINVNANDGVVYCSQTPYIRNESLRANIILDLSFDEIKYKRCIMAACLLPDLEKLSRFDLTLIGDEGVTLSGGQKMRINFARALYRKSLSGRGDAESLYLFDAPLSSVDIYVGKDMFVKGIYNHLLDNKNNNITCLMVINSHLHLLEYFDEIIIMENGKVALQTTVNNLFFNRNVENNHLLQKYQHLLPDCSQMKQMEHSPHIHDFEDEMKIDLLDDGENEVNIKQTLTKPKWSAFVEFIKSSFIKFDYKSDWYDNPKEIGKSNTKLQMIKLVTLFVLSFMALSIAPICDLWLLRWNQNIEENNSLRSSMWHLSIWLLIVCFIAFGTIYLMRLLGSVSLAASNYIHNKSLCSLLRANTLFFDLTPKGEIFSRFTTDTHIMDNTFIERAYMFLLFSASVIGYLLLIIAFIPFSVLPMLLISPALLWMHYKFANTHFQLQSLQNDALPPITTLFAETVPNLDSIRAYKLQSFFIDDLMQRIGTWHSIWKTSASVTSWLYFYQEILFAFLQFCVIVTAAFQMSFDAKMENNTKQFIILACWYFFAVIQQANYATVHFSETKGSLLSVMRVMHYHDLFEENEKLGKEMVYEAKQINHEYEIKENEKWPAVGNLNIHKLRLRYRKKFNIVLDIEKGVEIKAGDKIGICGRTGSGKSSILVSIFRLFEPLINDVVVDDLSIDKLGLYDLRSNLSIISQTPVLFNGTLKFNLDPFDKYSDEKIWNALKDVELFDLIKCRDGKLLCNVNENGSNFSVGEQQLICFVRSILNKSSILFADEPTSAVDKNTDNIIQKLIRSDKFRNVTVICIAHRLETILDYDYILLLENGKIKQYDTPQHLLSDKNGDFAKLIEADRVNYCAK